MAVSIAFTKYTDVLFHDNNSTGIVTEEGAVNVYRNGFGGVSGFRPICGESRFTTQLIAGTASGNSLVGTDGHVRWPYWVGRREAPTRTMWQVDLTSGALTQATADPGSGASFHASRSDASLDYAVALRGFTSGTAEIWYWSHADQPSASMNYICDLEAPYDLEALDIDIITENIWVAGTDEAHLYDPNGTVLQQIAVPGVTSGLNYVAGVAAPDSLSGRAVVLNKQDDAQLDWFVLDQDGTVTDITASVTIDGVAWDTVALGSFGAPAIILTKWGNRIGFKKGFDYYIGVVTDGACFHRHFEYPHRWQELGEMVKPPLSPEARVLLETRDRELEDYVSNNVCFGSG